MNRRIKVSRTALHGAAVLSSLILGIVSGGLFAGSQHEPDLREYITKYSKNNDDTEAFRQLLADMGKPNHRYRYLEIPAGSYYISDTIDLGALSDGEIRGNGYPEIIMTNPEKDIFVSDYAWKMKIDGIAFKGGRDQLFLRNNNIDQTNIQILNCRFSDASGFAIRFGEKMYSAHILIDACAFRSNMQTLLCTSDWVRFSNSWITTNEKMLDKAVIVNHGCLTLDHLLCVPLVSTQPREKMRQRWIDNDGLKLTCRDVRFGGEGGGLPIVWNFRKANWKYPAIQTSILLEDCWLYCAGTEAIRFFKLPNQTKISFCTGMIDAFAFRFDKNVNLTPLSENPNRKISIELSGTNANAAVEIPQILQPMVHVLPAR